MTNQTNSQLLNTLRHTDNLKARVTLSRQIADHCDLHTARYLLTQLHRGNTIRRDANYILTQYLINPSGADDILYGVFSLLDSSDEVEVWTALDILQKVSPDGLITKIQAVQQTTPHDVIQEKFVEVLA